MSTRVTVKGRLSFPELFEPKAFENNAPKFSTMILIPKSDKATLQALKAAEKEAAEAGRHTKFGGTVPAKVKSIIHDGDEEAEDYPERKGHWRLNVASNIKFRPQVVDKNLQPVIDQSEVYSGVYANVSLTAFAYNTNGNKGVTFGLNNVQILGYGENLAGGVSAADEFEVVEDDDEDLVG